MRVVIDPNVLISAVLSPSAVAAHVVEAVRTGQLRLVSCPILLEELAGVLARPKFRRWVTEEEIERYCADLAALAEPCSNPRSPYPAATRDPDDDYLVALALEAGVDALISGDTDFADVSAPHVLTPRQDLDVLDTR